MGFSDCWGHCVPSGLGTRHRHLVWVVVMDNKLKELFLLIEALIEKRLKEEYQRGYEDCLTEEAKK
jgi:hypothetical protein